jgi:glycosyltransferase involved in cell wall biosynthesis
MSLSIDAVIPALNEADTVGGVVLSLLESGRFQTVIVVDNSSTDNTAQRAKKAGAKLIRCEKTGLGHAVKAGARVSDADWIFRTDADIVNWSARWAHQLVDRHQGGLTRAIFQSDYDQFPANNLVASPWLREVFPEAEPVPLPLSGTYICARDIILNSGLSDDWSFDISLICHAVEAGLEMIHVDIGTLIDKKRPIAHYVPMAEQILRFMLGRYFLRHHS